MDTSHILHLLVLSGRNREQLVRLSKKKEPPIIKKGGLFLTAKLCRYGASAAQALGLSMWESLACSFGGQCLIAIFITLNGRSGAVYHVGFPIMNRAAFGVYGAWWPTFNRAVMAIVRPQKPPNRCLILTNTVH